MCGGRQGAHGFRAQSPWAPRVGAFINLESTGPGGPDFVFQARLQSCALRTPPLNQAETAGFHEYCLPNTLAA